MLALNTLFSLTLLIFSSVQSVYSYTWGFPYDSQKIRGVNLGGWLLLEVRLFVTLNMAGRPWPFAHAQPSTSSPLPSSKPRGILVSLTSTLSASTRTEPRQLPL